MLSESYRNAWWIHLGAFVLLAPCGEPNHELSETPVLTSVKTSALVEIEELGVLNAAMPTENLLTSAQLTEDQFNKLVARLAGLESAVTELLNAPR